MTKAQYHIFDPVLPEEEARSLVRLCEDFGTYGMYAEEPVKEGLGAGLAQRHDAARNFIMTGGRFSSDDPIEVLGARTNYFRETYAYAEPIVAGIEGFHRHEGFMEAAKDIFDRPIIEPAIVYANLLVPGQELAVHTDVPEFRGVNRTKDPEWLIVAMLHSGLFDKWRIPIATAVSWYQDCEGGEFCFYPDGKDAAPSTIPARFNTAVVMDTDSYFHGVDRMKEHDGPIPELMPGMKLVFEGDGMWRIGPADAPLARYRWDEMRFSISWKAYCFQDEAEREAWRHHTDDISQQQVVDTLVADLRKRGRLGSSLPDDQAELAITIIDEYIKYPPPASAAA